MKEALRDFAPAATDCSDGFEAAGGELVGACVAAIHSPVEQVHLIGIELQEQDDHFIAKLVDLIRDEITAKTLLGFFLRIPQMTNISEAFQTFQKYPGGYESKMITGTVSPHLPKKMMYVFLVNCIFTCYVY